MLAVLNQILSVQPTISVGIKLVEAAENDVEVLIREVLRHLPIYESKQRCGKLLWMMATVCSHDTSTALVPHDEPQQSGAWRPGARRFTMIEAAIVLPQKIWAFESRPIIVSHSEYVTKCCSSNAHISAHYKDAVRFQHRHLIDVFFLVHRVEYLHEVAPSQFALADTATTTAQREMKRKIVHLGLPAQSCHRDSKCHCCLSAHQTPFESEVTL